ncbi:MAG: hypothetical protein ACRDV9_08070, partial [Acidimicrobiia bacterium]
THWFGRWPRCRVEEAGVPRVALARHATPSSSGTGPLRSTWVAGLVALVGACAFSLENAGTEVNLGAAPPEPTVTASAVTERLSTDADVEASARASSMPVPTTWTAGSSSGSFSTAAPARSTPDP